VINNQLTMTFISRAFPLNIILSSFPVCYIVYLRRLEQVIIDTLHEFDIESTRVPGLTGVWIGDSKVAAIGIKLRRWVTMHGLSINVNPDLRYFKNIVPCGISDKAVSSIVQYRPDISLDTAANTLMKCFSNEFDIDCNYLDAESANKFIGDVTSKYSPLRVSS
jgi:lipoyl(octanoyl) transferase